MFEKEPKTSMCVCVCVCLYVYVFICVCDDQVGFIPGMQVF